MTEHKHTAVNGGIFCDCDCVMCFLPNAPRPCICPECKCNSHAYIKRIIKRFYIVTDAGQMIDINNCTLVQLSDDEWDNLSKVARDERIHNLPEDSSAEWYELN